MIAIDGGQKSGSGTIVRCAVALAALLGEELEIKNIRAKREKPGLRAQHLGAILACKDICSGEVENAIIGSKEIKFNPRGGLKAGKYEWDIGTAGSTTMLAQTVLPLACFADNPSTFIIQGGLFQDFAPSFYHMQFVLIPILRSMGVCAELTMLRPGYVPRGGGIIELKVQPLKKLKPISLMRQGEIRNIKGIAISSHLEERKVSHRMAQACKKALAPYGYKAEIEEVCDTTSPQEGAALAIYAETSSRNRLGADRAGSPGRSSESIGRYVAQRLMEDVSSGAAVDRYAADQLIIYSALADSISRYSVPFMTEHIETDLWLVEEILEARTSFQDNVIQIKGVGFK
jgi:RNA 3'-terminal phosphate cyclase (ATP)